LRALRPWARRFDAIRIEFLEPNERMRLEESLQRDYLACGCGAGRVAFGVALALLAVTIFAFHNRLSVYPTELLVLSGLLVLALVTSAAMLVSLVRARVRVNRTIDRLIGS
jgi:hypothetical protein